MAELLIKDFPSDLHRKLAESAARHRRSLPREALVLLKEALTRPPAVRQPPRPLQGNIPLTQELLDKAKGYEPIRR